MPADPAAPPLLRGVDRAAFAVAFATRLRSRGLPVGFTPVEDFVRALGAAPPRSRGRLYWTARITLVRDHAGLAVFDAVFAAVFEDAVLATDPNARRRGPAGSPADDERRGSLPTAAPEDCPPGSGGLPWVTLPRAVADDEDSDGVLTTPQRLPSELAGLVDVPFELLGPEETALLGRWLESAVRTWPTRRSRRFAPGRGRGRIALRPTLARSRRTGWEPMEPVRVTPVDTPRRVVMLCDVSRSMQAQAVAYLHLMRALALTADAEVFAFATSLTRLTAVLRHRSAEVAIDGATSQVTDRFGGTRIATCLGTLLASHHGGALRGAIVIIGSDGWDGDSPEQLATAMARLRRRAYRVIWMNPRASAPGFEPRVATMAAALPYCDALLPADSFRSLARVIREISRCVSRTSAVRNSRVGDSGRVSSTTSHGPRGGTVPP
ncbi:VWA domain-containing protein [Streptomyces sp. NPDC058200]|uniref:vWA domain-containing protein n=1 Tax=Streptomyces sp. NPDC058200 TaxID=3346378 RepID=UPI0036E27E0D